MACSPPYSAACAASEANKPSARQPGTFRRVTQPSSTLRQGETWPRRRTRPLPRRRRLNGELLENDLVRVLRCADRPGDRTTPHEVIWNSAQMHVGESTGTTDTRCHLRRTQARSPGASLRDSGDRYAPRDSELGLRTDRPGLFGRLRLRWQPNGVLDRVRAAASSNRRGHAIETGNYRSDTYFDAAGLRRQRRRAVQCASPSLQERCACFEDRSSVCLCGGKVSV